MCRPAATSRITRTKNKMAYEITSQEVVHPVKNVKVGEEPVLDSKGDPVIRREVMYDDKGQPLTTLVETPEGILQLKTVLQDVPVMKDIVEALPDLEQEPDGLKISVSAVDSQGQPVDLEFTIGKAAFLYLPPEERPGLIQAEIALLLAKKNTPYNVDWTEGLGI